MFKFSFPFSPSFLFFILYSLFLFLFFLVFLSPAFSQTPKQWIKLGNDATADGDFIGAAQYYKNALSTDSANLELTFKYAESLRKSNDYKLAEYYYQKIYDAESSSQSGNEKNEVSPQLGDGRGASQFWLATMQKFNGDYTSAKENFRKFEKIYRDKSSYYAKKAKQEVKSCEFAKKLILDTISVEIINGGDLLNSFNSESAALLYDDSTMYFSSLRPEVLLENNEIEGKDYRMKIYTSKKMETRWKANPALDTVINHPSFNTGNGTFSNNKKRFYFSRCTRDFKCAIYMSEIKNEGQPMQWQTPLKLENGINNENYSSTQPMLAEMDGDEILFFVSDMPGGKGKSDIWTVNLTEIKNGKTNAKPKNLAKINTIDNDISPFYDAKNKTLYFSSEWYYGLGGLDIFKTKFNKKIYSSPENMGFPYNSSANDLYFSFYSESNNGFLTSNRKGSYTNAGETCCNDIYEYELPREEIADSSKEEKKYSSLEMLNKYLPVTLYFHNDEPNSRSWDTLTALNYLKTYNDYFAMIELYKKEYGRGLSGENKEKAENDIAVFFSDYVEKGVNDLELFSELLLKELEKGDNIELTVKGYASPLAKTDYNVNLTLRRISSLQNYLKESMDGAFVSYFNKTSENGGTLEIVKIPFGEYNADITVSDNLNDQRNSVFSRKAALERKIEILSATRANNDSIFPEIAFEEEIHDFGTVEQGEKLSHIFNFKNNGKENLLLKNVSSSCGCTVAKWTRNELLPGGKGEIEVTFDTAGRSGKQVKTITIETNAVPSTKVIHVTAEVMEK